MTDTMTDPMPAQRRPGGLTALGVLNIIFAALGMLFGLGMSVINSDPRELDRQADMFERANADMIEHPRPGQNAELNRVVLTRMAEQIRSASPMGRHVMDGLGCLGGVLMFVSAFGLFGRRRYGKHLALGAGVALFGCTIVALLTQSMLAWGFPILGTAYAIVLVAVTQSVYKRVLVN